METTKESRKLTCRGSNSPSYTSYALLVVWLLGGNRNHVTTNCENPQLRNAQLPDKAVTFCACANSYISSACTFAGAFAYFSVYSCYFKTVTFHPRMLTFGTLSARENIEDNSRAYVFYEILLDVRVRKCMHRYNRIKTGYREKTRLLSLQASITKLSSCPINGSERIQKCPLHN
jgi:hypothetical protein